MESMQTTAGSVYLDCVQGAMARTQMPRAPIKTRPS
ncbi:hypothetical protein GGR14_003296 [Butyricimonas faecihominis]|uniref:Uncharacterized protein n=1 Tax=Butyricimonas faecihominis TaxID=1472416 RepID=A0A7W6MZZ5_9BACT|nr:hypothetical protein [Butyricimonas faecihominis]